MSPERAGTPTHGHLDREKARAMLADQLGSILLPEEIGDDLLDAMEACVVPDLRLTRIEAMVSPPNRLYNFPVPAEDIRAILRGDQ
jgi:hypothetical protein